MLTRLKQRTDPARQSADSAFLNAEGITQIYGGRPEMAPMFSGWSVTVQAMAEAYQPPIGSAQPWDR